MWFGEFERYDKSKLKVLTVGLNPSDKEFSEPRFDKRVIRTFNRLKGFDLDDYYKTLNEYFMVNPYKKWFGNFEKVLKIFRSSYGGKMTNGSCCENIALHVDICSPFATCPTWGGLCNKMQERFEYITDGLFEELIEVLDPDVIIMSCGKQIIDKRFSGVNKIYATGACSKFIYGFNWRPKKKGHAIKVICGRNMRGTPFGMITIGDGGNMKSLVRKLGK